MKHLSEKENYAESCNGLDSQKKGQAPKSRASVYTFLEKKSNPLHPTSNSSLNFSTLQPATGRGLANKTFHKPAATTFHSNTARYPLAQPTQPSKLSYHHRFDKLITLPSEHYTPVARQKTFEAAPVVPAAPPKREVERLLEEYSQDILSHLLTQSHYPKLFLANHSITSTLRAKMVDWMVEVLTSYKCREQTYFLAIQLMDNFLAKTTRSHLPQDLHLLGVACMFISCKYEEIYPVKLQIVHDKIAHKKLSKEDIKAKESEILNTMQFDIIKGTFYEITMHLVEKLEAFKILTKIQKAALEKIILYIAKMAVYDYELLSEVFSSTSCLAAGTLIVASQIFERQEVVFLEDMLPQLCQELQLLEDDVDSCAKSIRKLALNFEKMFPNLENLKKFSKYTLEVDKLL